MGSKTRAMMRVNEGKPLLQTIRQTEVQVLMEDEQRGPETSKQPLPFKALLEDLIEPLEDEDDRQFLQAMALVLISTILNDAFYGEMSELAETKRMAGRIIKSRISSLHRIVSRANNEYNGDVMSVLDSVRCSIIFRDPDMCVQIEFTCI